MHAHFLVPDINLLQITGSGGLAWDTTEQIKFILPFRDDKADLWLGMALNWNNLRLITTSACSVF
jgi:hypothetical protein